MSASFFRKPALAVSTLALAGATLAGLATAAPAQAATPSQATAAACQVPGHGGSYICEYGIAWQTFPNGGKQVFVVGTDFSVWTRYGFEGGDWSNWESMGGVARSGVRIDGNGTWNPTISVVGSDGVRWYRHRLDTGSWTGWSK
ncbi:hypothetical protein [Streptomyces rimosus]|uniref:hypothetical protein n=1 Tax=Streptomyces rimosus TaxID=1927 RepID=UPI0004C6A878|nr:hypothetical protein [Streptomyces rimosus]